MNLLEPKYVFNRLLEGDYIMLRAGNKGTAYCLYTGKMDPVSVLSKSTWKHISELTKEKDGKHTIDKRLVRALHGNDWYKKQYKQFKKKTNGVRNNKSCKKIYP